MGFAELRHRLTEGRPLVLDADAPASFRARGVALDVPGALGLLLREQTDQVLDHYLAEIGSNVDVLTALTADTTPRALTEVGMQHRASRLTSLAVDLALQAASEAGKPVAVAGVLGAEMVSPLASSRLHDELHEHAHRLAVAGCEVLVCKGLGSRLELMASVVAAASTDLPTWAIVEARAGSDLHGDQIGALIRSLEDAGASAVLFEVGSVADGIAMLGRAYDAAPRSVEPSAGVTSACFGVLVAAGEASLRGFHDDASRPEAWARRALDLDATGARIIGGGAGTTEGHTAALARELRQLHPSIPA